MKDVVCISFSFHFLCTLCLCFARLLTHLNRTLFFCVSFFPTTYLVFVYIVMTRWAQPRAYSSAERQNKTKCKEKQAVCWTINMAAIFLSYQFHFLYNFFHVFPLFLFLFRYLEWSVRNDIFESFLLPVWKVLRKYFKNASLAIQVNTAIASIKKANLKINNFIDWTGTKLKWKWTYKFTVYKLYRMILISANFYHGIVCKLGSIYHPQRILVKTKEKQNEQENFYLEYVGKLLIFIQFSTNDANCFNM